MKYKADIWEYERGWGSRLEETKVFDTEEERDLFIKNFNARNTEASAPDWYMVASKG